MPETAGSPGGRPLQPGCRRTVQPRQNIAHTATTASFLQETDAVIFVTSFESPLTEAELIFFDQVRGHVRKIFVVVNKRDLVPAEGHAPVLAFAEQQLQEVCGDQRPQVYCVSARDALRGKQNSDAGELQRSGPPQWEADFGATPCGQAFLARLWIIDPDGMMRRLRLAHEFCAAPRKCCRV